jgi:uncharacterized protein YegP (UPF0339 family)
MMRNFSIYVLITCLFQYSCKEFIESPVTDKKVTINAPADGLETNKYSQQFWWDVVEDATAYRLQVVIPSFQNTAGLVLDTLIKDNKFTFTFEPGEYEWRVRAENGSTIGTYTVRKFIVHESSLSNQQVQLQSPSNGFLTNNSQLIFKWLSLFGAEYYLLQVDTNNFIDEAKMVLNQRLTSLEYRLFLTKDAFYQWRIRAGNVTDSAKWSKVQNFTYDANPPGKVLLTSPINDYNGAKPINLRWNSVEGANRYQLTVYKSDSSTPYNNTFPLTINTLMYSFNLGEYGEVIYWSVRALDAVGNLGTESELRRFTVQ